jgi:hypothetical protein
MPSFTRSELVGQAAGPVSAGDSVDVGVEFDALPEAAGAVVVTVTVGVADWRPEDAQLVAAATQANAAAATASRPALGKGAPGNTGVPFMRAAPHAPLSHYDDRAATLVSLRTPVN